MVAASVVIGDDVEIGANTTIDRGAIEDTIIEDGVKLDNQIQIGHNCRIGAHTAIAGCVGIAGSTTIGRHCMIGGAAMIGGHLTIADRVIVAGSTVVTKSISTPGTYLSVFPAEEAGKWRRLVAHLRWMEQPANSAYRYDHIRDNCSTRIRDAIDDGFGEVFGEVQLRQRPLFGALGVHRGAHVISVTGRILRIAGGVFRASQ